MVDRKQLEDLRDSLKVATGPDASLDNAIFAGLRGLTWLEEPHGIRSGIIRWDDGILTSVHSVPKYTEVTDIALTLADEWQSWFLSKGRLTPDEPAYGVSFFSDEAGDNEVANAECNGGLAICICLARVNQELAKTAVTA